MSNKDSVKEKAMQPIDIPPLDREEAMKNTPQ